MKENRTLQLIRRTNIQVQMKLREKEDAWKDGEKTPQNAQEQAILKQLSEYLNQFKTMIYKETENNYSLKTGFSKNKDESAAEPK